MKRYVLTVLVVLMATFGLAGCGDDEGDLAAYCDLTAALDDQEDFPSDEQLEEIQDVAPAEISDEVDLVAERFKEANDDPTTAEEVFNDPEMGEAFEEIEAYEDANCPAPDSDEGDVDEGTDADVTTTTSEDAGQADTEETTTTVDETTTTTTPE